MFAVLRNPNTIQGKFLIQMDNKKTKQNGGQDSSKAKQISNVKTNFENSNSSINSTLTTVGAAIPTVNDCEKKEEKKIKIRLSTIKDVPYAVKYSLLTGNNESHIEQKLMKKTKMLKLKPKRINKDGLYNCGRWQPEEHERFIEAILKYGNEWKSVQKHVGTRSSTQARSHAQKFFVKIKKTNFDDLNIDFSKNSIKTLHEMANNMSSDDYFNAIKALNCVVFEKGLNSKKKQKKTVMNENESDSIFSGDLQTSINLNNDEIFSINTNDQTFVTLSRISEQNFNLNSSNQMKNINYNNFHNLSNNIPLSNLIYNSTFNKSKIREKKRNSKTDPSKISQKKKKGENNKHHTNQKRNTIIINNNINNYNYNVNINNFSNFNHENKNENNLLKKRNRQNSFENFFNLFPEIMNDYGINNYYNFNFKKPFDETEYVNNFNCTFQNTKNDFDTDKDFDWMLKSFSHNEEISKSFNHFNGIKNKETVKVDNSLELNFEIKNQSQDVMKNEDFDIFLQNF